MSINADFINRITNGQDLKKAALQLVKTVDSLKDKCMYSESIISSLQSKVAAYELEIKETKVKDNDMNAFIESLMNEKESYEVKINMRYC